MFHGTTVSPYTAEVTGSQTHTGENIVWKVAKTAMISSKAKAKDKIYTNYNVNYNFIYNFIYGIL